MSQRDHGGTGGTGTNGGRRTSANGEGNGSLMSLIRQRQAATGSTQILDLSSANLEVFPTEIESLRDVLEKLTMSHNSIKTLPLQLNMFTSLRYLNIRANSIKVFPPVLCHLSSLEILDMSRNKISRLPDSFGSLMNLRVLSISRNRIETIPTYIGEMTQLQFLKIEQNLIVFPPAEIVDPAGQDMESWLNRLKSFLVCHKREREAQLMRIPSDGRRAITARERASILQQRGVRSASLDSLALPPIRRQGRTEAGMRLSLSNAVERSPAIAQELVSQKVVRTSSQHGTHQHGTHQHGTHQHGTHQHGTHQLGDDHYRFISHSRGVSADSTSSFGSNSSNDCDKYSDVYFQRLAAYPPVLHPLPGERLRLAEAARGILFALAQIYRAVKQVVGCSADEKFCGMFTRLLQSANSAVTQLIQSLDRFDSSAQVQVPDKTICSEILRCCESNVAVFRKLVHVVQAQIRTISIVADARLVRNMVLMLHGALAEIRVAWDSLLPLTQGSGEFSSEIAESGGHNLAKDLAQRLQQPHQSVLAAALGQGQHQQQGPHLAANHTYPYQLSPTIPSTSSWLPAQIPQRSQNMSRTSNHSAQSTSNPHEDEEDVQLLLTVEHAIEVARRVIQCLTETCMTRAENLLTNPQQKGSHRTRSVSASPPRSTGSGGGSSDASADFTSFPNGMSVADTTMTSSAVEQDEERTFKSDGKPGFVSRGPSKALDQTPPSLSQDETNQANSQAPTTIPAASGPIYQPIMTARSASVSGLPMNIHHSHSSNNPPMIAASSLPSQGFMGPVHPHVPVMLPSTPGPYPLSSAAFSFSSGGLVSLPAAQLWREMKDCLLHMTEIVKRLDVDLNLLRTDDHTHHPHHSQHAHQPQHIPIMPHSPMYHQTHAPHPHHAPNLYQQHGVVVPFGANGDDSVLLRRRFGLGVSDFVKAVIVISTLVRHLSSGSSRSGSVSVNSAEATSRIMTTTAAPMSSSASSSSMVLSTSPSNSRARSGSGADISTMNSMTSTMSSSTTQSTNAADVPQASASSAASLSASASTSSIASGATTVASSDRMAHIQHLSQSRPPQQTSRYPQPQQQQPEVFSRLVVSNVSSLTKITKELTMRMPRSSFRDYLLSSSGGGGGSNGGNGVYGGYGPVGTSILAMRKGSLI